MMEKYSLKDFYNKLPYNDFVMAAKIPMGYGPGLPMYAEYNEKLCLQILYWRCKVTGEKNKNLIYPVRYVLVFTIPEGIPVYMHDLKYDSRFKSIDFTEPIGFFPHKKMQSIKKTEYLERKNNLIQIMSNVINSKLDGAITNDLENNLRDSYIEMLDPCLKPFYEIINRKFFSKYVHP